MFRTPTSPAGTSRAPLPRASARLTIASLLLAAVAIAPAARAAQSLIPLPYPGNVSGGEPLDPEPQGLGGPQTIMKDPYPQILGDNAQGDPPISRVRHHQRLVPGIYKRKYRVDRPGY